MTAATLSTRSYADTLRRLQELSCGSRTGRQTPTRAFTTAGPGPRLLRETLAHFAVGFSRFWAQPDNPQGREY